MAAGQVRPARVQLDASTSCTLMSRYTCRYSMPPATKRVQMGTFQAKLPTLHNSAHVSARHHGMGAAGKASVLVRVWNARRARNVRPVAVACLQPASLASGGHSQHAPEIAEVSFQSSSALSNCRRPMISLDAK